MNLAGVDYITKNWALAMMLKALPLVHFWSVLLLKEQMMTSVRQHLQISEDRSSDCSDVISEILVHISDQIGRSSVVYRICGIGIPKGQQQRVTGLHLHAIQLRYDRYTARLGERTRYYRVPMPM